LRKTHGRREVFPGDEDYQRQIWYHIALLTVAGVCGFLLAGILDGLYTFSAFLLLFSMLLIITAGARWCRKIGEFVVGVLKVSNELD
jgi:hypothetical protein